MLFFPAVVSPGPSFSLKLSAGLLQPSGLAARHSGPAALNHQRDQGEKFHEMFWPTHYNRKKVNITGKFLKRRVFFKMNILHIHNFTTVLVKRNIEISSDQLLAGLGSNGLHVTALRNQDTKKCNPLQYKEKYVLRLPGYFIQSGVTLQDYIFKSNVWPAADTRADSATQQVTSPKQITITSHAVPMHMNPQCPHYHLNAAI